MSKLREAAQAAVEAFDLHGYSPLTIRAIWALRDALSEPEVERQMWQRLAQHQPFADQRGYGAVWAVMCAKRTPETAWVARDAAMSAKAWSAADAAEWAAAATRGAASLTISAAMPEAAKRAVHWIKRAEEQE